MVEYYFDHAATTRPAPEVIQAVQPYLDSEYGNPSSLYGLGFRAKSAVEAARIQCAKLINAEPNDIYFTSGGTESDNQVLVTVAEYMNKCFGLNEIITTPIEHPAVLRTCDYLKERGFVIKYLPVDKYGLINPKDLYDMITDKTAMISVMLANNEIGTIEPLEEIGEICVERGVFLHSDAVQAYGNITIDVGKLHLDALSASSHKINGLLGTGLLYLNKELVPNIEPFIHGGGQEKNMRAGTENVPGIVAMGCASALRIQHMPEIIKHNIMLRNYLTRELLQIDGCHINGIDPLNDDFGRRLPSNLSIRFDGIDGYQLQALLADNGICVSNASACHSGVKSPSHVLKAIGLTDEEANSSLRLTVGSENTLAECDHVVKIIKYFVEILRKG